MAECRLDGETIEEGKDFCSYCGLPHVDIIGQAAREKDRNETQVQHRKKILDNIPEVGVVLKRYKGVKDDKVVCDEEYYPLLFPGQSNNGKTGKTVKKAAVFYGKKIKLYFKTKHNKTVLFSSELKNIPEYSNDFQSFEISANINAKLKLDVFCHVKGENQDGIKSIESLKLGTTLLVD